MAKVSVIRIFPEIRHKGPHRNLGSGEVCVPCAQAATQVPWGTKRKLVQFRENLGRTEEKA